MSEATGKVLVACPTYAGKEYCIDDWVNGFKNLKYEPKFAYQVDNTRISMAYYELLKTKGIDVTHLTPWPDWDRTFKMCWELILKRAQDLDCYWVYSVEADNIPSPESLEIMINIALYGKLHLVTHSYPMHQSAAKAAAIPENSFYYNEMGCMLMTKSLLERSINEFEEYGNIALCIFETCTRYHGGYCKLTNRFEVKHLDGYKTSFQNLEPTKIKNLFFPGRMPDDFGTEKPKCLGGEKK